MSAPHKRRNLFRKAELHDIKVDKGVPMPKDFDRHVHAPRFPFKKMEIGDSILISREIMVKHHVTSKVVRDAARHDAYRSGYAVLCRLLPEGLRIWRIG